MSAVFPPLGGISLPNTRPTFRANPATTRRGTGLVVVVALHVVLAWGLASGLATKAVEFVRKPIDLAIIPELTPPPPPPPPPKIVKLPDLPVQQTPPPPAYVPPPEVVPVVVPPAPVIQAVQPEPPPAPVVIAPPPPPAPPPPAPAPVVEARPAVVKREISVACPGYQTVLAQLLEEASDRVGIAGTVQTLIKIRGSQVVDVTQQSGPKEYTKYLQTAIKRLRCSAGGADEVLVSLPVHFK
jgi:protein TonB